MSATMTTVVPHRRVMSLHAGPPRVSSLKPEPRIGQYILGQTLGEGEFGKVKLGWPAQRRGSQDDVQVAIKLIRRESIGTSRSRMNKIEREITVLKQVHHPNIVKCYEVIETERYIGIILEYASGGELFDFILAHRYLKDPVASKLFAQLISAVEYLHERGIVHRDLKLENLLLDRNRNIIVTDFGFANTFDTHSSLHDLQAMRKLELTTNGRMRGDLMNTSCGSPCYAAPELVVSDGSYCGRKVDVWSCGVILYAMLAGYLPFDDDPSNPEGDNITLLYKYIVNTPLTFPEYITPLARDLLRKILVAEPKLRASLDDVIQHSWLSAQKHHVLYLSLRKQRYRASVDLEAQDMIRSSSERPAAHSSFALPQDNHLTPTGFSKNSSMGPSPASLNNTNNKRHTVQIEYCAPLETNRHLIPLPADYGAVLHGSVDPIVETLSIPVAPTMARGVSHSGEQTALRAPSKINESQANIAQIAHKGSIGRGGLKLPVPVRKPRPTSYHPGVTGNSNEIMQQRIPSDPASFTPVKSGSSGSHFSRASVNSWSGAIQSKTASPRSTNQNAAGELYSVSRNELASNFAAPGLDQSKTKVSRSHRRNASSISSMLGKIWQSTNLADNRNKVRDSMQIKNSPMDSIGEAGSSSLTTNDGDARARTTQSVAREFNASNQETGDHQVNDTAIDNSVGVTQPPLLVKTKQLDSAATDNRERFSTTAARRVMNLFTSRRREKAAPHS